MAKIVPVLIVIDADTRSKDGVITVTGRCMTGFKGSRRPMETSKVSAGIDGDRSFFDISFDSEKGLPAPRGYRMNKFTLSFDIEDALGLDVQNKVWIYYDDPDLAAEPGTVYFSARDMKKGDGKTSELYFAGGKTIFFRQTRNNTVYLTVRPTDRYDLPEGRARLDEAYEKAQKLGPSDMILMYEKDCRRFEESASVLFRRLIDLGYENVGYILDKECPAMDLVEEKYRPFIIDKDSPEHLLSFFRCSRFIGTETVGHALSLRASDRRVIRKVQDKDLSHVFLQHGVMYMVSLDSEMRAEFRNIDRKFYRVVVSSQKEADHFIELGGFDPEELYITGLAKFDTAFRNEGADRIVIMPTWRRWEINDAGGSFEDTGYARLTRMMYDAVPDDLKEKVMILPHPLMRQYAAGSPLADRFAPEGSSYDEILRDCDVLITDYSSIAYDAFYRGAKVVFCWRDIEECMEKYGGAHLMLDRDTAFGDVCFEPEEITEAVRKAAGRDRDEEYVRRFKEIVSFDDGKNTDRIIDRLIKDGILEQDGR